MQGETATRLQQLAARIATEKDLEKFEALVREMNELLDGEAQRLKPASKPPTKPSGE